MDERDKIIAQLQKSIEELEYLVDIQKKTIKMLEDEVDRQTTSNFCCLETNCPNRLVQRIRRIEYGK